MPNKSRFIIWGASGHSKVIKDMIEMSQGEIIAMFDNNKNIQSFSPDIPLYCCEKGLYIWRGQFDSVEGIRAIIAIGGSKGADRIKIAKNLLMVGLSLPIIQHPTASISRSAEFGKGCQFLANSVVAADVRMGDVCIINHGAIVDHECHLGNGVHIAPGATLCGCVGVGDNTMIGAGAVILPRINIGRNVVVGAGSIVTKSISDYQIVAGNPARKIKNE
jgi:sugar O-acyltransferase (sialic acid O-acetyltransferase NeuD family)